MGADCSSARARRPTAELAKSAWARSVPELVRRAERAWRLELGRPLVHDGSNAHLVPARTRTGEDAILKIGFPHFEARDEIAGLRFWTGDPTVHLLDAHEDDNVLLIEACVPGASLRERPPDEQDIAVASILVRAWRSPPPAPFRHLGVLVAHLRRERPAAAGAGAAPGGRRRSAVRDWLDVDLVREGVEVMEALSTASPDDVTLMTDLHAGNVLAARRAPWLAIDPKPFVGDRAYDVTQHLINHIPRLRSQGRALVDRMAGLLDLEPERVRAWTFARLASEAWPHPRLAQALARRLAH